APTVHGKVRNLRGYLGAFELEIETATGAVIDDKQAFGLGDAGHDLVLDLQTSPALSREVPPLGYSHAPDTVAREQALHELPEMLGEFQKPRFVMYDADICAHGERGLTGCSNCLDVCAADAPFSLGERIEID